MLPELMKDLQTRMDKALSVFNNELKGLRTGRASTHLLDPVTVEVYGNMSRIEQLGTVSTPDARTISIQVWDKANVKAIEKAIVESNLGVNPSSDGQYIRINIPPLNEERRKDLIKMAGKYCENTKISIRNIRRDGMEDLKKFEKSSDISKDEHHSASDKIQKLTDDYIKKCDDMLKGKETEIMQI